MIPAATLTFAAPGRMMKSARGASERIHVRPFYGMQIPCQVPASRSARVLKVLLSVFIITAVIAGSAGVFLTQTDAGRGALANMKPKEKAVQVRLEVVERGDLVRVVSAPGTIEPRTKVQISAQVSARIIALPFRLGDEVREGDVVIRLDADDYLAQLQSAHAALKGDEARLAGLQAELATARAELTRAKGLFETKDISKADLEQAEAAYLRSEAAAKAGEFTIEVARAQIARAQKNLDLTTIRAPMDGVITRLDVEVGEQVLGTFNNAGTTIMEIADLQHMILKAKIDEVNIVPVRAGQQASVSVTGYRDREFRGLVDLVGLKKMIDRDGTGYFETVIAIEHGREDGLRSGLTANVEIQVQTFPGVLKVPSQAVVDRRVDELPKDLVQTSGQIDRNKVFARVVYAIGDDGKARTLPVSIGTSDLTHTMIIAGLGEGERIVTGPYRILASLKDGQKLEEEAATSDSAAAADAPRSVSSR
jgi:HlyD family secretion protein